ncbi:MAG: methyltransferase domain-containing protein [Bacteriovoracaceae bacterium]|jgi:ubiquinone/menaquinone biosynthesis C-methylase UbiE|nr:methyltransferase domain-containing protein [Bacteriovoracaceae bacterium]
MSDNITKSVQEYYGESLQSTNDLKTNACCTLEAPSEYIMNALRKVHDDVQAKYYGCGLVVPTNLKNQRVLDLGSGSGRDCYIVADLVGESGKVVGVDMTQNQLDVALKYEEHQKEVFGYQNKNTQFLLGNIEKLEELNFEKESFDIIISNCVINLAVNKQKVLNDAYALLSQGGEMYFSDVYSDRRIPEELVKDEVLYGECLSGALYWNDFLTMAKKAGFADPRFVESKPITINNKELEKKCEGINFYSVTYRLFKLDELEADCEDYGQAVKYKGNILEAPNKMFLDDHHVFEAGRIEKVCGNTFNMLNQTRYKENFEFYGDMSTHYGIFEGCGGNAPFDTSANDSVSTQSCC